MSERHYENQKFENLKLTGEIFESCRFADCEFINCTFDDCNLVGIDWGELLPASAIGKPVSELRDCHLKYNAFTHMGFSKFDFSGCEILDSIFAECDLAESNFTKCRLEKTEFLECDLRKADFREATGYRMDIMSSKMKDARFSFPEALNLLNGLGIMID